MSQINSTHSKRQVSKKQFDNNWDKVFGKKKKNVTKDKPVGISKDESGDDDSKLGKG